MIRTLAVDDEPLALKQLTAYIEKVPFLELVSACHSAQQARQVLEQEEVDAMFLDINMPGLSGMDLVKGLAAPPLVVFTTAYSEYALEGYKVDAVDYLLKPFGLDDFKRAAMKVRDRFNMMNGAPVQTAIAHRGGDDTLFFKADSRILRVEIGDIVMVEGMSEYLKIHLAAGQEPVIVLLSMKKLLEELPEDRFLRVHKSYIVNLRRIREVGKGQIIMDGGARVPIGDLYRDSLQQYIDSKFLGK